MKNNSSDLDLHALVAQLVAMRDSLVHASQSLQDWHFMLNKERCVHVQRSTQELLSKCKQTDGRT